MRFFLSKEEEDYDERILHILRCDQKNFAEIVLESAIDAMEIQGHLQKFNEFCLERDKENLNLMQIIELFCEKIASEKTDLEKQFNEAGQEMSER